MKYLIAFLIMLFATSCSIRSPFKGQYVTVAELEGLRVGANVLEVELVESPGPSWSVSLDDRRDGISWVVNDPIVEDFFVAVSIKNVDERNLELTLVGGRHIMIKPNDEYMLYRGLLKEMTYKDACVSVSTESRTVGAFKLEIIVNSEGAVQFNPAIPVSAYRSP